MSKPPSDNVGEKADEKSRVGCAHQGSDGGLDTPNDPIAAQIQAEINDHLATAAEKLQSQGLTAHQAQEASKSQFGDTNSISRRCYWIQQGDTLMFRTATIALLTLLCLTLGILAYNGYRSQRQMAEQMSALAEQLKSLADQQRVVAATPAPAESKPLEITGKVFLRSPSKPAAETEVMICRVSDGETVRRVTTTATGEFRSGPLTAGDYTLLAKSSEDVSSDGPLGIQSAPIYLYPGSEAVTAAIDAGYHSGRIHVKLTNPLPNVRSEGKYVIASRLYLSARPSDSILRSTRWVAAYPAPNHWPVYVRHCESPPPPVNPPPGEFRGPYDSTTCSVMTNDEIANSSYVDFSTGINPLPAGPCSLLALVVSDIGPDGSFDLDEVLRHRGNASFSHLPKADRQWMSDHWVRYGGIGGIWHANLLDAAASNAPPTRNRGPHSSNLLQGSRLPSVYPGQPLVSDIVIGDGQLTRLEIEVPPDLQSSIQTLVDTVTDPAEFARIVQEDNLLVRKVKINVLGTESLAPALAE